MEEQKLLLVMGTAADMYLRLGWCPSKVVIQGSDDGAEDASIWTLDLAAGAGLQQDIGDGIIDYEADHGITLVKFENDSAILPTAAPSTVEPGRWWEANGIKVPAASTTNAKLATVHAFRLTVPFVRAVHDGGDNETGFFQDSSIDFLEAGISPNGKFILIDVAGDTMAYVGAITKPAGQANYCRIYMYEDEDLTTVTSTDDFDDDDVAFIIPRQYVQYPLITART